MKRISAVLALTAALTLGVSAYAQETNPTGQVDNPTGQAGLQAPEELKDIPAGHWAQEAVKIAAECGIVRGYPDGTFRGNRNITRYEAAAIVARLLEAIRTGACGLPNPDGTAPAEGGLNAEDLEALQNAIQELAADLADLGVRVSELEDNAVTQDDLARVEELANQARDLAEAAAAAAGEGTGEAPAPEVTADDLARVEELANEARDLAEAAANNTGAEPQDLTDLIDQIEAASIAADTALAQSRELQDQVDELGGRVDDLEAQLGELGATVEGQADSIAALNDLVVLLNQDVLSLQDRVAALEGSIGNTQAALDELAANAASQEDLEALREFTTLLRRDQTALADRVSDLEARVAAAEAKNAEQDKRLQVLEDNGFTISGTISLKYYRAITWYGDPTGTSGGSPDFDIDRLGITTVFSSGKDKDGERGATSYADFGAYGVGDFDKTAALAFGVDVGNQGGTGANTSSGPVRKEGRVTPSFSISLAMKQRNLVESSGAYNTFPLTLTITFGGESTFNSNGSSDTATFSSVKITKLAAKYLVGAAPITFDYGINPTFKFGKYLGSNGDGRGHGFVMSADGAGLLPFGLKLTGVYGSKGGADADNQYFRGVKGEASLIPGLSGGVYFIQEDRDIVGPASNTVGFGLNFGGKLLGLLNIEGEYDVSNFNGAANSDTAGYVKADADLGFISVGANYRSISPGWGNNDNIALGSNDGPYATNQVGFGVSAALKLGFLDLSIGGFFDSRTPFAGAGLGKSPTYSVPGGFSFENDNSALTQATIFGVGAGLRLLGFDLGFAFVSGSGLPTISETQILVKAVHDGTKAGALIGGLNLALGFENITKNPGSTTTEIYVYGDTTISLGGLKVTPKGWFDSKSDSLAANDSVSDFGFSLTASIPFLLDSSLDVGAALDNATHTAPAFSAATAWAKAGLTWSKFILPNSSFSVAFAYRTDVNRSGTKFGPSLGSPKGIGSWGSDAVGSGQTLSGLYFTFGYYGLNFAYGIFQNDSFTDTKGAMFGQAFSITYNLKF